MTFSQAHPIVFKTEGGYVNVSVDRGGETYGGISRPNHPNWRGWPIVDAWKKQQPNGVIQRYSRRADLDQLATDYLKANFWDNVGLDNFPAALRLSIYDMYVNSGSNVWGVLRWASGSPTWNKSQNLPELYQIAKSVTPEAFAKARIRYYEAIAANDPSQAGNLNNRGGWRDRALEVLDVTKSWITQNPGITAMGLLVAGAGLFFLIKGLSKKKKGG